MNAFIETRTQKEIENNVPLIDVNILNQIRKYGGEWYIYQNHDMGHHNIGHIKLLKCGQTCTFKQPPERYPDTPEAINWRYILVGKLNLATGELDADC